MFPSNMSAFRRKYFSIVTPTSLKHFIRYILTSLIILLCFLLYANFTTITAEISSIVKVDKKSLQFQFVLTKYSNGTGVSGIPFNTKWNKILDQLNLLNVKAKDDKLVLSSTPVIVTAISSNHIRPCKDLLRSIENVYNKTKLVYLYDLGLSNAERDTLTSEFGNVIKEIRGFEFGKYPQYVKKLRQFRWKPLIVAEMLKDFQSVWWMDASVRISKPLNYFDQYYSSCTTATCKYYPWLLVAPTWHSIYAATDFKMYNYLPIPLNVTRTRRMWMATIQLIFATKEVKESVLRYWVLCALEEDCLDPTGSKIDCIFNERDLFQAHADCHRQDQSAINILLSRVNNFDTERYCHRQDDIIKIYRDF